MTGSIAGCSCSRELPAARRGDREPARCRARSRSTCESRLSAGAPSSRRGPGRELLHARGLAPLCRLRAELGLEHALVHRSIPREAGGVQLGADERAGRLGGEQQAQRARRVAPRDDGELARRARRRSPRAIGPAASRRASVACRGARRRGAGGCGSIEVEERRVPRDRAPRTRPHRRAPPRGPRRQPVRAGRRGAPRRGGGRGRAARIAPAEAEVVAPLDAHARREEPRVATRECRPRPSADCRGSNRRTSAASPRESEVASSSSGRAGSTRDTRPGPICSDHDPQLPILPPGADIGRVGGVGCRRWVEDADMHRRRHRSGPERANGRGELRVRARRHRRARRGRVAAAGRAPCACSCTRRSGRARSCSAGWRRRERRALAGETRVGARYTWRCARGHDRYTATVLDVLTGPSCAKCMANAVAPGARPRGGHGLHETGTARGHLA